MIACTMSFQYRFFTKCINVLWYLKTYWLYQNDDWIFLMVILLYMAKFEFKYNPPTLMYVFLKYFVQPVHPVVCDVNQPHLHQKQQWRDLWIVFDWKQTHLQTDLQNNHVRNSNQDHRTNRCGLLNFLILK